MFDKLQIYFQPSNKHNLESFTITYSRFDKEKGLYRRKVVLEKETHKYKQKIYFNDLDKLEKTLSAIDFTLYPNNGINPTDDLYFIRYGDNIIQTNNKKDILDLLNLFEFDTLVNMDIEKYEIIE